MKRTITALEPQKRNPRRFNVHLDETFAFGLSQAVAAGIKVGQEISDEEIKELLAQEAEQVAYLRALNFISYRPRSGAEVRKNLKKKDIDEQVIDQVVERLRQNHLVDDMKFAQEWVENRSAFRPRSRWALAMELRQKGIGEDLIEDVLEDIDDEQLAYQAARKQARKYGGLTWQDFRRKMSGFLARRGFRYETISPVVRHIWSEKQNDTAEGDHL
jgi:regulatory protein